MFKQPTGKLIRGAIDFAIAVCLAIGMQRGLLRMSGGGVAEQSDDVGRQELGIVGCVELAQAM